MNANAVTYSTCPNGGCQVYTQTVGVELPGTVSFPAASKPTPAPVATQCPKPQTQIEIVRLTEVAYYIAGLNKVIVPKICVIETGDCYSVEFEFAGKITSIAQVAK